jgi:tetratricopeptide (TPR) repeat protein
MQRSVLAALDELRCVFGVGAPTASVFCAARSLELLTVGAVERLVNDQPGGVYAALCRLADLGLLPSACGRCFHGLRRLGNDARHRIHAPISMEEAELAAALLLPALRWGTELGVLDRDVAEGGLGDTPIDGELCALVSELAHPRPGEAPLAAWGGERVRLLQRYESLGALHAEHLITLDQAPRAEAVLTTLLSRRPDDLRLRQLFAWARREQGELDEALDLFQQLYVQDKDRRDPETCGLYAGTLKRAWADDERWRGRAEGDREAKLRKTHEAYKLAWVRSKQRDGYCGINAASTAVMLRDQPTGELIAERILALYASRARLPPSFRESPFHDYWDHATYAEALLVAGRVGLAREEYRRVFASHLDQAGAHKSTRFQLALLLQHLDPSHTLEDYLP